MSYGLGEDQLSKCAAEFLTIHPYFNPDSPIHETLPPTVELISPRTYPAGSESVSIRLKVGDSDGLHQVILYASSRDLFVGAKGFPEVKACRGLSGERDVVVEFEYDGSIPSSSFSSLSDPIVHPIRVRVVDTGGDESWKDFILSEISSYHIATLEGHTDGVWAMAVSPDGGILASGAATLDDSKDTTVRLWDVASREEIATLKGHTGGAYSVAFSPDGALLAAGSRGGTILLWDVASRTEVGSLNGHRHGVWALAFSRDGTLLASGATDFTVRLWDVANRKEVGSLKGHTNDITSVAFSPDGNLLASGSEDGMVILWDVLSGQKIVAFPSTGRVRSVVFLGDDATLASGSDDGTILLWDVSKWTGARPHTVEDEGEEDREMAFGFAEEVEDQAYTAGTTISALVLPEAVGGEGEITYRVSALPAGLSFDATTRTISGTPEAATDGAVEATYTAQDSAEAAATLTFSITVNPALSFGDFFDLFGAGGG